MERFSVSEVIEQAIQTEKLGYDFYNAMAKRFEKEGNLKKLFDTLAMKEREHEKMFSGLMKSASHLIPENWGEISNYLRAIVESEFFLGKDKSLPSLDNLESVEDAVRFAVGFEKETLLYYHSLRDVVKEKDIIDEIIDEEKNHIAWLSEFKKTLKEG